MPEDTGPSLSVETLIRRGKGQETAVRFGSDVSPDESKRVADIVRAATRPGASPPWATKAEPGTAASVPANTIYVYVPLNK